MKQFKSSDIGFKNRVFRDMKRHLILSIFIPFVVLIVELSWLALFFGVSFSLLFLIGAILANSYSNRFYLELLEFKDSNKTVHYRIKKFDSIYKDEWIKFSKFDVEVYQHILTASPQYTLILKYTGKEFFRQREAGDWDAQRFKDILQYVRKLQGRPAYTDYISV